MTDLSTYPSLDIHSNDRKSLNWYKIKIKHQIRSLLRDRIRRTISILYRDLKRQILFRRVPLRFSTQVDQRSLVDFEETSSEQSSLETDNSDNPDDPVESLKRNNNDSQSKKGISYARISNSDQASRGTDGSSIEDQIEQLRAVADDHNIEIDHEIVDEGQTGTNFDRDGIQKVFRLAQRDDIGYLLTQSVDRIGRSAAETLYFIYILQSECNVTLVTPSGEQDMGSIHGLMHTTLLSLMAEVQNEIRTSKAKKSRVSGFLENKNWHCYDPTVPLGYTLNENEWLEVNPEEAPAVEYLFEKFLECERYAETKRAVNDRYNGALDGHRVKTLLQRSVYIGKPKLPEEWVTDTHYENELDEPQLQIVDEDTFRKAQKIIKEKDQIHSTDDEAYDVVDFVEEFDLFSVVESSPPAKLLHDCGEPMVKDGQRTLKGDVKVHLYRCPECDENRRWPRESEYDLMKLIYEVRDGLLDLSEIWK